MGLHRTNVTDINEQLLLVVENGVHNYGKDKQSDAADATLPMTRSALDQIMLGEAKLDDILAAGEVKIEDNPE